MNFERYLGVIHPFVHRVKLTKKKLSSSVFSACATYTVIFLILFFNALAIRRLFTTTSILLSLISAGYFYIRIFLAAKNTRSLQNPPNVIAGEESTTKKQKKSLKERKLVKSCFMIVILFVFSFLPMSIISVISPEHACGTVILRTVRPWCVTTLMLNSSLNSIIFYWARPLLRKEALKRFIFNYWIFFSFLAV